MADADSERKRVVSENGETGRRSIKGSLKRIRNRWTKPRKKEARAASFDEIDSQRLVPPFARTPPSASSLPANDDDRRELRRRRRKAELTD